MWCTGRSLSHGIGPIAPAALLDNTWRRLPNNEEIPLHLYTINRISTLASRHDMNTSETANLEKLYHAAIEAR